MEEKGWGNHKLASNGLLPKIDYLKVLTRTALESSDLVDTTKVVLCMC